MTFALLFLFFFTADILIGMGFPAFGLAPVQLLFASVGVFTVWATLRNLHLFKTRSEKQVWFLFLLPVLFITIKSMVLLDLSVSLYIADDHWYILNRLALVQACLSAIVFLNLILSHKKISFARNWHYFCAVYITLHGIFWFIVEETPTLLYHFSGVLDLPIMFGWLVLTEKMLHKRIGYDQSLSFHS